ncbi:putative quinol monooxygenase [Aliiroseovarius sp. KMU-50]|uniref:Quinol monooxygenase n=1 Tax=Aliiroseovarius salicola TaxID=3009082 RepID=A0ABT4W2W1_9RHOB|nr:putative quinol monooxygenase [Aliiroseovarius sp. KMU-50]MDA5094841.1 putative quinol monooxygenase [Aliiroseovarius sp. KMU-50]
MTQYLEIVLTGYIDVPEDRLTAVSAALPAHISLTLAEPGCLSFEVLPDPDVPGRFNVSERFANRADFDAHQSRMKSSPWADVTKGIQRHYQVSEIAK